MDKALHTRLIKEEARRLGFSFCGVSKAGFLDDEARRLERWLQQGMHGQMGYMENHFDKRLDPTKLVEGAKSVVSFLYNYYTPQQQQHADAPKISKYAYHTDYHFVVKDKLKQLLQFITDTIGEVHGRAFVDSAPVMERAWAKKSGLGWTGKHTLLINKQRGSYFFLGELIIDLELEPDAPIKDYCGTCTACIDACPTEAITPYWVDGSKCISYLTIELKDEIPAEFKGKMDNWAFGCDICQQVCPWNRFSQPHNEPEFEPHPDLMTMDARQWHEITEDVFKQLFKNSPVKRTGYKGLKRTLTFLKGD
ncbi:MAG: tRNA epoxyqueuosine(34) reductase QueG [Bacteroidetes bacterium]|nr:MAG: tRNA epoxyqueuosine(34) reductase QueG [Bacteroidota bacterium]